MARTTDRPLKLLIAAPAPGRRGGVTDMVATLQASLPSSVEAQTVHTGAKEGIEGCLGKLAESFKSAVSLVQTAWTMRPDVIQLNPSLRPAALLRDGAELLALRAFGFRNLLVFFHGWDWRMAQMVERQPLRGIFRWVFERACEIDVLGTSFRRQLVELGFDPGKVFVTTTMFDGSDLQGRVPNGGSGQRVVLMARLVKEKGAYEAACAFEALAEDFPEAELIIAGDGPERSRLEAFREEARHGDRIRLAGFIQGAEKRELLMGSDVYIAPTQREGIPLSMLEAMASGLVVVTTVVGGIGDVFKGGDNGIVLEDTEVGTIESALRRVLADEGFRKVVSQHNYYYAWKDLEASVVARDFAVQYERISAASG